MYFQLSILMTILQYLIGLLYKAKSAYSQGYSAHFVHSVFNIHCNDIFTNCVFIINVVERVTL